jgi:hypothetical protein
MAPVALSHANWPPEASGGVYTGWMAVVHS